MPESNSSPEEDSIDVRQLANAIRLFFFAIVFGLSCIALAACQSIDRFETIYKDMLGGKPLPLITQLVLSGRVVLFAISFLVPTLATATLFSRRVVASIYILGACGLILVIETSLLFQALFAPLIEIIRQMGAGAG